MSTPGASLSVMGADTPTDDGELLRRVGERIQQERKARGWSRRELSEISGVSPRYLAQIEGEGGNLSIGVLQKIAQALAVDMLALFRSHDPQAAEIARMTALLRAADPSLRARVMQLLDPQKTRARKAQRICLLGLRGAGKSTLGALVAEDLGVPFVELNRLIEDRAGVPMGEVIALYGENGYREIEAETLKALEALEDRLILAVAGGVVTEPAAFQRLLTRFHTVWIKASPQEHMDRVRAQGDMRPMAGNPQAMQQLRQILSTREALYAQAEYQVDTSGRKVAESRAALRDLIAENGLLAAS